MEAGEDNKAAQRARLQEAPETGNQGELDQEGNIEEEQDQPMEDVAQER